MSGGGSRKAREINPEHILTIISSGVFFVFFFMVIIREYKAYIDLDHAFHIHGDSPRDDLNKRKLLVRYSKFKPLLDWPHFLEVGLQAV